MIAIPLRLPRERVSSLLCDQDRVPLTRRLRLAARTKVWASGIRRKSCGRNLQLLASWGSFGPQSDKKPSSECVEGRIRLLMGRSKQTKMEVWGRSEKMPSFALVCGCFWRFLFPSTWVSIGWPDCQPQEMLRDERIKTGGMFRLQRPFLPAVKKKAYLDDLRG